MSKIAGLLFLVTLGTNTMKETFARKLEAFNMIRTVCYFVK